jgi:microcystin-dependent protein
MWAGYTAMPAWVTACTNVPYLLCDGSVYNVSAFPSLGAKLLGKFGGNGVTTFAVPDSGGRIQLPYDTTGARITVAGCGINGQTIGASQDQQTVTLTTPQIPAHNHGVTDPGHAHSYSQFSAGPGSVGGGGAFGGNVGATTGTSGTGISIQNTGGGGAHNNVQPSQVTGIMVIRAG